LEHYLPIKRKSKNPILSEFFKLNYMKKLITSVFFISLAGLISCKKSSEKQNTTSNVKKVAPDGFNYSTTRNVTFNLQLQSPKGEPIAGVVVSVYRPSNTASNAAIFKAVTDKNGNISAKINVPTYLTSLVIDPAYIGLLRNATANINGDAVTATLGGPTVYGGDIIPAAIPSGSSSGTGILSVNSGGTTFSYPSPYTSTSNAVLNTNSDPSSYGVPKYLVTSDVISATLLSYVNASLPEGKPVTTTHPNYLSSTDVSTLNITATSDVWITYVAEGAGNLNSLAFYTYTTGNPPTSASDIKSATLIFPNASGLGSGGGLVAGDKVKIGTFNAGTSIGFILLGNAWTGSGVSTDVPKYYSDDALNPETDATLQKHTVVLYDAADALTLIGFEDLNRQTGNSDNDFNDLVFYATSNPVTGISHTGVPPIATPTDSDGDGVPDDQDAFPNDPTRAYINYYPSATGYANIAFEDNWPTKGDYDMNDLVLGYRYTFVTNAQNEVVTIQADYNVAAVGASFKNGFGLQLPIPASAVKSVSGELFKSNYISLASNGVEAGQTNAVVIPFDNTDAVINNPDFSYFINTENSKDKITQTTVSSVLITLTTPIAQSSLNVSSFNPFLISNGRRTYEIHLPGYAPTDKADPKLFGTGDDASAPSTGKYYLSTANMPWAITYDDTFIYPLETISILSAYPHFADWAASSGTAFTDWYTNTAAGYRVSSDLYLK
jgi:LruC domain-containing protein